MSAQPIQLHPLRADIERLLMAGIPWFPCDVTKAPRTSNGFRDATTDRRVVSDWLRRWPDALPGVVMGPTLGVEVIDVDVNKDTGERIGEASLDDYLFDYEAHQFQARTPSGGRHLFFEACGLPTRVKTMPGIDTRGSDRSYVIAWDAEALAEAVLTARVGILPDVPSDLQAALTNGAGTLEPLDGGPTSDTPLLPAASHEKDHAASELERSCADLGETLEGERNSKLNTSAYMMGRMVAAGWIDEATVIAALEYAAGACGLTSDDGKRSVTATIRSGLRAGKREPRSPLDDPASGFGPVDTQGLVSTLFVTAEEISNGPVVRHDLVEDFLPQSKVVTLYGASNIGKSFLALDLGLAVATGRVWQGHRTKRAPVAYIAGEGHDGIGLRVRAWKKANNVLAVDDFHVSKRAVPFSDPKGRAIVVAELGAIAAASGNPGLIIVDTLATNTGAWDENSNGEMGQFVAVMSELRHRYGATVLVVHHVGHSDGTRERGAYALRGNVDMSLYVRREDGGQRIRLETPKVRDGRDDDVLWFERQVVDLGVATDPTFGEKPINSLVFRKCDPPASARACLESKHAGGAQRNFVWRAINACSEPPDTSTVVQAVHAETAFAGCDAATARKRVQTALGRLIADGDIVKLPADRYCVPGSEAAAIDGFDRVDPPC